MSGELITGGETFTSTISGKPKGTIVIAIGINANPVFSDQKTRDEDNDDYDEKLAKKVDDIYKKKQLYY
ncbi:hypothetical protein [Maribacter sp. 4G9]|uniref:hypothetical protein n=1 Tax=Maribacter sp. 4G9 TaxID=1889777 RepID=UPI000C1536FC|nr:hypothetical protein [Maribacter sp. 4G9]PIB38454.1 hypothetical protein BFP75_16235 [Maribacter sp. 4G9]